MKTICLLVLFAASALSQDKTPAALEPVAMTDTKVPDADRAELFRVKMLLERIVAKIRLDCKATGRDLVEIKNASGQEEDFACHAPAAAPPTAQATQADPTEGKKDKK